MGNLTFDELLKYSKRTMKKMRDENGNIKSEYKILIEKVNNSPEYSNIISRLQETDSQIEIERLRMEFENKNQFNNVNEEKTISKQYGISLESIEHIKLHDGKEYYHFYDIKLNKDVILRKNNNNRNMSEEFTDVQEGLSAAQTTDEQTNGEEAFRYQRLHTNNEVKLYNVEELISNPELVGNLNMKQMKVISVLLKNKDILRIKQINPETGIAIDDRHKIITSYYNEKNQKYEVNLPNKYEYTKDVVSIPMVEKVSQNNNIEGKENIEVKNDFVEEKDGILIDQERVKLYYEYPELLDKQNIISETEKKAYIKAIQEYQKSLQSRQNGSSKDSSKVLVYKDKNSISIEDDQRQAGFINLLLLSLITGFAGGIITAIMLGIIK